LPLVGVAVFLVASVALGQEHGDHHPAAPAAIHDNPVLNAGEIITGLLAAVVAFQAAMAYREGRLGKGVTWVAVGMVIMSVGHFILVAKRVAGFDLLGFLGATGSFIAFSVAVFSSFLASAYGFWQIRKAAGGK
jgi:hypothetical protein